MTIATVGSPVASYPEIQRGAEAAAKAINEEGGIDGKKIKSLFCNSRGEPDQALTCVRDAVKEHVAAVVGRLDLFDGQTTPILEEAGIPDLGTWAGGEAIDTTSEYSYPLSAGSFGSYAANVYGFKEEGYKHVAVLSLDLPVALGGATVTQEAAEAEGVAASKNIIKIPVEGVSDYTPYAQQMKDEGADSAVLVVGPTPLLGLVKADKAIGNEIPVGSCLICGVTTPEMLIGSPYPPVTDKSNAGIAAFNKELVAAGYPEPTAKDTDAYPGLTSWLAMHVAAEVAKSIEGEITAKSMTEQLNKTSNLEVEDLVDFSPAELGSSALGKFPRLPKTPYQFLKVSKTGAIEETDLKPVEDPIGPAR